MAKEKERKDVKKTEDDPIAYAKAVIRAMDRGLPATTEVNPPGHWKHCEKNST